MPEKIIELDQSLFLFLNGAGSDTFDPLMVFLSSHWFWVPVYILLGAYFIKEQKLKGLIPIAILFITLTATDQASVHLFKEVFERLRPCHEPGIMDQMRLVTGRCGGQFGFVSSHATNSFGLAFVSAGLIRKRWFTWTIMIWALVVSYSRIYLGVHYPGDILGGMILGIFIGWVITLIYRQITKRISEYAQTKKA